jgi:RNA polymerase sigma factor (TIGR02999 family)
MPTEPPAPEELPALIDDAARGKHEALDVLLPLVYDELRRVAAAYMRRERPGQTIQATALVHEAYLRLLREPNTRWQNRAHFCAIAAGSMRQILVERARARGRLKRAGDRHRVTLTDTLAAQEPTAAVDVEALDHALTRFAAFDPESARLVELRFFGGLTIEETAEVLGVSPATVKRNWAAAKAWLGRELSGESRDSGRQGG